MNSTYQSSQPASEGLMKGEESPNPTIKARSDKVKNCSVNQLVNKLKTGFDTYSDLEREVSMLEAIGDDQKSLQKAKNALEFEQALELSASDCVGLTIAFYYSEKFDNFTETYGIELENKDRIHLANEVMKKYRYAKRTSKTTDLTIYCNSARTSVCEILGISVEALIKIEELVEAVCNDLNIIINGKQRKKSDTGVKSQTWNKKSQAVRYKVYAILKRILWHTFRFRGPIIQLIVRRLAYHTGQNKTKAKNSDDGSALNRVFRKNVINNNPWNNFKIGKSTRGIENSKWQPTLTERVEAILADNFLNENSISESDPVPVPTLALSPEAVNSHISTQSQNHSDNLTITTLSNSFSIEEAAPQSTPASPTQTKSLVSKRSRSLGNHEMAISLEEFNLEDWMNVEESSNITETQNFAVPVEQEPKIPDFFDSVCDDMFDFLNETSNDEDPLGLMNVDTSEMGLSEYFNSVY